VSRCHDPLVTPCDTLDPLRGTPWHPTAERLRCAPKMLAERSPRRGWLEPNHGTESQSRFGSSHPALHPAPHPAPPGTVEAMPFVLPGEDPRTGGAARLPALWKKGEARRLVSRCPSRSGRNLSGLSRRPLHPANLARIGKTGGRPVSAQSAALGLWGQPIELTAVLCFP
jgi:hypothetical protein